MSEKPKCSSCGQLMIDPKSIKIGTCLWCRPWLPKSKSIEGGLVENQPDHEFIVIDGDKLEIGKDGFYRLT